MPSEASNEVEIHIKVDKDLANWLARISKYLPYSVNDIVVSVLKFYMNTWLMIENVLRQEQLHLEKEEELKRQESLRSIKQLLEGGPSNKTSEALGRILRYRKLVKSFSEWLSKQGLSSDNVPEDSIDAFIKEYVKGKKNVKSEDIRNWLQTLHDLLELKRLGFAVEEYIASYEAGTIERKKALVAKYKGLVKAFMKWLSDRGINPSEASNKEINAFLSSIKQGYSEVTLKKYYQMLKYFLDLYNSGEDLSHIIGSNQ
jgi:uncharacterized protein YaaR (DUF327 family)